MLKNDVSNITQKKYLLIYFERVLKIEELPEDWKNFISNIYFIQNKKYNFIEFNDSKYYNKMLNWFEYNKINTLNILDNDLKFYVVKNKPLLLNPESNILFIIFANHNTNLNYNYILGLWGSWFFIIKILILKKNNSFECLIQAKNKSESIEMKYFLENYVSNFNITDINIYFSKKKNIKIEIRDIRIDKNCYIFDINKNFFKDFKFLSKHFEHTNYEYLEESLNSLLEKTDLLSNYIYNNGYYFLLQNNWLKYQFNNIIKLLSLFINNFKIISNINEDKMLLILYGEQNWEIFIVYIRCYLKYKYNTDIIELRLRTKLLFLLYVNSIHFKALINILNAKLPSENRKYILKKFYYKYKNNWKTKVINNSNKINNVLIFKSKSNIGFKQIMYYWENKIKIIFFTKYNVNKNYYIIITKNFKDSFKFIVCSKEHIIKLKFWNEPLLSFFKTNEKLYSIIKKYQVQSN